MNDKSVSPPPVDDSGGGVRKMRRKKSLNQFVVMTKVGMDNTRAKETYARDEINKEFYLLTRKCSVCGSQESESEGGGTSDSTTTTPTTTSDVSALEKKVNDQWLTEQDVAQIDTIREGEGHYNRLQRQKQEVVSRRQRNKLNMVNALRIQTVTRDECDRRIAAATEKGEVSVNLNAFLIMSDGTLRPYNAEHGGCLYEHVRNPKHKDELVKLGRLHIDMLHHQEAFKQLFHIFLYLDRHLPRIDYIIYKRPIEFIGKQLSERLDFWDRIEHLFEPKTTGHYYAIIACIGFDLQIDK